VIIQQMLLQNHVMLKVFLSATATGMIVVLLLENLKFIPKRVVKSSSLGTGFFANHEGNIIGGLILGAGLAVSGSCPGTVYAQLGAGIPGARYVALGCLTGSFSVGLLHRMMIKYNNGEFLSKKDTHLLDHWMGVNLWKIALPTVSLIGGMIYFLENYNHWHLELSPILSHSVEFLSKSHPFHLKSLVWTPIIAGVVIGLSQIPSYLLHGHPLGTSSSFVTFSGNIAKCVTDVHSNIPYCRDFLNPQSYGQVGIVLGVVAGSFLSTWLSGALPVPDHFGISNLQYFGGGIMLLMGARLAGGCTSGHGISGMSRMSFASILTVICMFTGGIITANLLY